jgi:hypothetical protein
MDLALVAAAGEGALVSATTASPTRRSGSHSPSAGAVADESYGDEPLVRIWPACFATICIPDLFR